LHPFVFTVEVAAKPPHSQRLTRIRAGFSSHCFSNRWSKEGVTLGIYRNPRERRFFDLERYALSPLLPQIVRAIQRRKIYFGADQNFLTVELPGILAKGLEYRAYFDMQRCTTNNSADALLVIQSAYPAPKEATVRRHEPPIGFNVLLNHALSGTRPRKPG
jgi:hypothetical protein